MSVVFGCVIVWIVISIIVRILRPRYKVVDTIAWGLLSLLGIGLLFGAEDSGASFGLLIFIILPAGAALYYIGGYNKETVTYSKKSDLAKIECRKCGYNDLEIVAQLDHGCIARCKRCGDFYKYLKKGESFSEEDMLIIREYKDLFSD